MRTSLVSPTTPAQWQQYFALRYAILREPWQQPLGSERDDAEAEAYHLMVENSAGVVLAVGRCQLLTPESAQIRFMAVATEQQGKGFGRQVLRGLEEWAQQQGCRTVQLNAREQAVEFYRRLGYQLGEAASTLFGIPHWQMQKSLVCAGSPELWQQWGQQLQQLWHQKIPLSAFMQLTVQQFDGRALVCAAELAPNKNLHHSMFAGSIYALATLTGWGMVHLQLQALGLTGDIVLADANIRYRAPLVQQPSARVSLLDCDGDLTGLLRGKQVRQQLRVTLYSGQQAVAEFSGCYAVLPKKTSAMTTETA